VSLSRASLGLLLLPAFACTDAELYGNQGLEPPDLLTIEGSVCTDDPAERSFPVKVVFLVDTSISDADYTDQRAASVEKVVRSYPGANYSFTVIRYAGPLKGTPCGQRNLTPDGFTRNTEDAVAGLRCSDSTNPGRAVMDALSLANSVITGDVLKTPLGIRARTKYVVVLLANGRPTPDLSELWCSGSPGKPTGPACDDAYFEEFCSDLDPPPADCERAQYLAAVRGLRQFVVANGAQELFFHVVYQRDPDDARVMMDDPEARSLYAAMAVAGSGSLYSIPGSGQCEPSGASGGGCIFSAVNLDSTQSVFQRKQLIVSNRNALARVDGPEIDGDADGLSDAEELRLGTDPRLADTDGDLLSDRVEDQLRAVGLDPLVNQAFPDPAWPIECPVPASGLPDAFPPELDQDGDGLTDCEENLLRTEKTLYDTDADGVPDGLEFRYGTNPLELDALHDTDADGLFNVDEFRLHLDPLSRDRSTDYTYTYELANEGQRSVLSFSQPNLILGASILEVSDGTGEGRGTLYYEPPADPSRPPSVTNYARLSWRSPGDYTPTATYPADVGRGPPVRLTGDGKYTLTSAGSDPKDPTKLLSVTVEVSAAALPLDIVRQDIRLRRSERFCFDFKVSNIQLVKTRDRKNYVDVYLAEVPTNNPTSYGVFRVATVPALYPLDLRRGKGREQKVKLTTDDFLLFGE
jgi:hypothetical protein